MPKSPALKTAREACVELSNWARRCCGGKAIDLHPKGRGIPGVSGNRLTGELGRNYHGDGLSLIVVGRASW